MWAESKRTGPSFDAVVIGAGVIGLAIASRLTSQGRSTLILERASAIARGITSRNSEVVHAGIYYPAGSLKARFCVEGRERLYAWCAERRVDCRRLGKLIVAVSEEDETVLEDLLSRGRENGVERLTWIDASRIAQLEPELVGRAALESPDTGIVDGHGLCLSLLAEAEAHGAVLALGREVHGLTAQSFGWRVEIRGEEGTRESVDTGLVVDAAGLDADRVAELAGLPVDDLGWRQHPCKGDYFTLAPGSRASPNRLVYPVPQAAGLGIHVTFDLAGRVRFGPDTEYVSALDYTIDPEKAAQFKEAVTRYWPAVEGADLVPDYSGIRPRLAALGDGFRDFVVEEASAHGAPGFVACVGIESPGLTASLAIAQHVCQLVSV